MVIIQNLDELKRIQESDFGFIIIEKKNILPILHQPKCTSITEEGFESSTKNSQESNYYWVSSISLAEKEFEGISICKDCSS